MTQSSHLQTELSKKHVNDERGQTRWLWHWRADFSTQSRFSSYGYFCVKTDDDDL